MKRRPKFPIFPQTLFIVRKDEDAETSFFCAFDNAEDAIEEAEHGSKVAIYELSSIRVAEITKTLIK
jgi:hypothetical protein